MRAPGPTIRTAVFSSGREHCADSVIEYASDQSSIYSTIMKQVLVELPDQLARRLEQVAPSRQRKRASFIRQAIQRALDEIQETKTEAAYREDPQGDGAEWFDSSVWGEWKEPKPRARKRR